MKSAYWARPAVRSPNQVTYLFAVVLLAIDLAACTILLVVDLRVLLPGQLSAVRRAICVNLLVDALLAVLSAGSFAGVH